MRRALATLLLAICAITTAAQNLTVTPTTTYEVETGNNTSAPSTFTTQTDGNIGAGNVSKLDTHTLLYPGFNGKIYAHVVGWFGGSNHENIGYNSSDPAVVKAQITDMASRGIDGIIHVWYGAVNNISNLEAQAVMNEAQNHPGFTFAIMIDHGAIQWNSCYPSCTATQAVIKMTQYIASTYFPSPSYMRINGRPVLTSFDIDANYSVDWNQVAANTPGNPIFLFQNNSGFAHVLSGGSYSWVMPGNSNYGLDYLGSFYSTGMGYPSEWTAGATYKGFNDTLASWSLNRIMDQQCGQTWLQTFQKLNSMYSPSLQIPAVQVVTWDDYEEGTEIETGIDNCLTVNASVTSSTLNWALSGSGSESTIDHYTVFISADGANLMSLGDFAAGTHSLDLASYSPAAGTYTLYVKAVGKPSITNKMSNASTVTIAASTPSSLSVTPTSGNAPLAVTATVTTAAAGAASGTTINFGDGTTVSGTTATHTYSTPGTYTVSATATNSTTVTANAVPPVAALSLSATSATAPATISASTAGSTDPNQGGSITGSMIDWGDGTTAAGPSALHSYATAGTYTVTATVTDSYGASSKKTQSLSITATPTGVTMTAPANGATVTGSPVHVVASASSPNGVASMILYLDYNQVLLTSSANIDTYVAMAPGSHLLAVNSWDNLGNLMQASSNIIVAAAIPTASLSLSASSVAQGIPVTATASGTDPNVGGSINNLTIAWGDGSSSIGPSSSHSYSNAGTYNVTATVTDNYGKSASTSQVVTVFALAAPTASMTVSVNGPTATVMSTSTPGSGTITSTFINWGDGTSTTASSASHTYAKGGYDTITVTVTNSYGQQASTSQQITAAGVVIWLPPPGATSSEPVHIAATAYDSRPIASMIVYLDGNQVYVGYVDDFDIWIQMRSGSHTVVVKAWEDVTGVVYQSSVRFKAQ
jgi:PKD repeat protein